MATDLTSTHQGSEIHAKTHTKTIQTSAEMAEFIVFIGSQLKRRQNKRRRFYF